MVTVPTEIPLARNCTEAIVPSASLAVAAMLVTTLTGSEAPETGEVIATAGAAGLTGLMTTLMLLETAWLPNVSVTRALRAKVPVAVGVQTAV